MPWHLNKTARPGQGSAAAGCLAKRGLALDPFGVGVDIREADLNILCPVRHQTPTQKIQATLTGLAIAADHGQQISGSGVPGRREVGRGPMWRDREDELDLAHIGGETDAATHARNMTSPEREPKPLDRGGPGMAVLCRTNKEHEMPGNAREMVTVAERNFPVRIRIGVPSGGLGRRLSQMTAWLDENCGSDGWAMTPSPMRGVLNDAISLRFADATLASAFVAR